MEEIETQETVEIEEPITTEERSDESEKNSEEEKEITPENSDSSTPLETITVDHEKVETIEQSEEPYSSPEPLAVSNEPSLQVSDEPEN
jgi:hypothetical protein